MARYRKLLVSYDGSAAAKNALVQACRLARTDGSWLKVLAVLPFYEGDLELIGVTNIRETMAGPGKALLAEAQAIALAEDAHILTNLEQGEPFERIVHVAAEENCDLIVMGRHGKADLEHSLVGSVTARVIGHTDRDVLVLPEGAVLSWERLLLATDGSRFSDAAGQRAVALAREKNATVAAVTVVDFNEEFFSQAIGVVQEMVLQAKEMMEKLRTRLATEGVDCEVLVKEGEPAAAIALAAATTCSGMILLGSHGRKGLTRLLMGSVTERVLGATTVPVLVCHA